MYQRPLAAWWIDFAGGVLAHLRNEVVPCSSGFWPLLVPSSAVHHLAAVDVDRLPRDIPGVIARQKN